MDLLHLESAHWLHQDLARLHQLLRRADVGTAPADGPAQLRQRFRPHTARVGSGNAAALEEAPTGVCEFDERLVPSRRTDLIHPTGLRRDAPGRLAPVPN